VPLYFDSWYNPFMMVLNSALTLSLLVSGPPGALLLLISASHFPFQFAMSLCISPGVMYACQACAMAAESGGASTGAVPVWSMRVESKVAVVSLAGPGSAFFWDSTQPANAATSNIDII